MRAIRRFIHGNEPREHARNQACNVFARHARVRRDLAVGVAPDRLDLGIEFALTLAYQEGGALLDLLCRARRDALSVGLGIGQDAARFFPCLLETTGSLLFAGEQPRQRISLLSIVDRLRPATKHVRPSRWKRGCASLTVRVLLACTRRSAAETRMVCRGFPGPCTNEPDSEEANCRQMRRPSDCIVVKSQEGEASYENDHRALSRGSWRRK
jgi:hypothetical protein